MSTNAVVSIFLSTTTFPNQIQLKNTHIMSTDYKFEGWVGLDANAAKGNMVWQAYEPKTFQETDIDVRRSQFQPQKLRSRMLIRQ